MKDNEVALELNVVCEYGRHIPELFETLIEKMSRAIQELTGLVVVEVHMHVEDVLPAGEFEALRNSQAPKPDAAPEEPEQPEPAAPRVE